MDIVLFKLLIFVMVFFVVLVVFFVLLAIYDYIRDWGFKQVFFDVCPFLAIGFVAFLLCYFFIFPNINL